MRIILKSLTMTNFMGEQHRTTVFNTDSPTTIAGMNGLGKSRHFDAFMWLLFGKDSAERQDYEIKSIVDGKPLHKCECSVEGELIVDGEIITIKRSFVEQWVKPRGCAEQIFKGNQTECTWNGVPVKVGEYKKRINEIIDENIFKMLTNPLFFASMPWKNQREQLFQLAGEINATDIANGNPAFMALMDAISGKSLEDYKKELSFRKKELNARLSEIQPKIDQTHALMPAAADFAAIEREIADIDARIAECDREIADVTAAVRAAYQAEQSKVDQVNKLRLQMSDIIHQAETAERDAAYQANETRREKERAIADMEREIAAMRREHDGNTRRIANIDVAIRTATDARTRVENERNAFRQEVIAEKGKKYDGSTTCPVCGQELPAEKIAQAEAEFNKSQVAKINTMVERGKSMNAAIEQYSTTIADQAKERETIAADDAELMNAISANDAMIAAAKAELATIPMATPAAIAPDTIPAWVELNNQVADIQATINSSVTATADTTEHTARKAELNARRAECVTILANRETIERCKTALADLEKRGKELAQQIADIEKEEFTIQEFTAANIAECERRINGLFHNVTFRLFDYTIDGNPIETCVPLVNGIPFGRANTAGRINAGLDIINALCRHYDTFAPIFLDNAESVNKFIETCGQVIMMRVTTEAELVIK